MRKKRMAFFIIASLLIGSLAGCSKTQTTSKNDGSNSQSQAASADTEKKSEGPVTITIWHDKEDAVAEVLQKALDTLAPDIVVNLERKTSLTDALKMVGNDPSSAPDMYFFAHDKIGVYAEMDILAPITDFVSQDVLDNYMDVTLDAASYNGTLYQMPIYYETLLFMYNKALMSESDVPKTTEALYSYMQANTKDGHYGFVEQHSTPYYSIPWIHGFGTELLDEEGTPTLDSQDMMDALQYHLKFVDLMPNESEYSTVNTLFMEGMADSIIGGPWLVPTAREAGIDLGFATMPIVDETGLSLAPYIGVQGLHVLKVNAEEKKDAITKILEIVSDPQLGIDMANCSGCAPANELSYKEESVSSDEMVMTMQQIAETAVPTPNRPEMDVMFVVAGNMLTEINMNGKDIQSVVTDYQGKAETLIESMK